MQKILTVYDAHVTPDSDLSRFEVLGQLLTKERPDIILQGGDYCSMEALSHWDRDKRQLIEGRRILRDFATARQSWKIIESYIEKAQAADRRSKRQVWKPTLVWMIGNHEYWVDQYIERHPEFEGVLDYVDYLDLDRKLYSEIIHVPWKGVFSHNDIIFMHAPIGRTGPIHSKYISARALTDVTSATIVFGHTHRNQSDSIARYDGDGGLRYTRAINAGCFFEEWPHYAEGNTNDYWLGCMVMHISDCGEIAVDEWPLWRMRNEF